MVAQLSQARSTLPENQELPLGRRAGNSGGRRNDESLSAAQTLHILSNVLLVGSGLGCPAFIATAKTYYLMTNRAALWN
ncbi:hypothetical protein [Comamonas sp. GB3 AK4-5]|uniref:hypothetical protein n=1 Tax=Comamonas sp. GB3 AK4-5 TaxID=3231487 RepID=UPI00351DBE76